MAAMRSMRRRTSSFSAANRRQAHWMEMAAVWKRAFMAATYLRTRKPFHMRCTCVAAMCSTRRRRVRRRTRKPRNTRCTVFTELMMRATSRAYVRPMHPRQKRCMSSAARCCATRFAAVRAR